MTDRARLRARISSELNKQVKDINGYRFDRDYVKDAIDILEYNYEKKYKINSEPYKNNKNLSVFINNWIHMIINDWEGLEFFVKI